MNKTKSLLLGLALTLAASSANAFILDFKAMANATEIGVKPLTLGTLNINGMYNNGASTGYAYLDGGWGGLGSCKTTNLSSQCVPGNDDNVTTGESLNFVFGNNVTIEKIWFNNNHDGDKSLLGDKINITGVGDYTFAAGDQENVSGQRSDWAYTGTLNIINGTNFDISWVDESFYVTAIEFSTTRTRTLPEPTILGLLALGLIGIGFSNRKKRS